MSSIAAPSGSYVRMVNPDTGAIMFIPTPDGFQLDSGSSATGVLVPPSNVQIVATAATTIPGTSALVGPPAANGIPGTSASAATTIPGTSAPAGPPAATEIAGTSTTPPSSGYMVDGHIVIADSISCYAPEDGQISALHLDAPMQSGHLVGMERFNASCDKAKVCRLVFRSTNVAAKLDNRETVLFDAGVDPLADFLKSGKASGSLVLVFATQRFDVINVDPSLWTAFTSGTSFMSISGTLYIEELRRLVPALGHIETLNICNQKLIRRGCLGDFARFIPPNITTFLFDTRYTSNATFIENVMALYGDLYMRKYEYKPCFHKLILVVKDFCQKKAFDVQLQRLGEMLFDDASSAAAILTMTPGDDIILSILLSHGFKRGRGGYFTDINRCFDKFDYWRTTLNGKTIVFGFRDRAVEPIEEKNAVVL